MSEMIERVARAIADAAKESDVFHYPYEKRKDQVDAIARAAIEEMREPTPEIGMAIYAAWDAFGENAIMGPEEAVAIYRAAIGAALSESDPTTPDLVGVPRAAT